MPPEEVTDTSADVATPEEVPQDHPQAGETIEQTMMRLGWDPNNPDGTGDTPDETPEPAPKKVDLSTAKAKAVADAAKKSKADPKEEATSETDDTPDAIAGDGDDEKAQLEALAKKLGLTVEDDKVRPRERVEFRDYIKKQKRAIDELKKSAETEIEKSKSDVQKELDLANKLRAAIEAGDVDGHAKALGFKDWNELQKVYQQQLQDPNYRRMRALEEKEAAREAEAKQREEQEKQTQLQKRREEAKNTVIQQNMDLMVSSDDPLLKSLADHPLLYDTIYQIQAENFDPSTKTYPDPLEAVDMKLNGVKKTVREDFQDLFERLKVVFGGETPEIEPEKPAEPEKKAQPSPKRPAPTTSNQRSAPIEPAVSKMPKKEEDVRDYFRAKLAEAAVSEIREESSRRNTG